MNIFNYLDSQLCFTDKSSAEKYNDFKISLRGNEALIKLYQNTDKLDALLSDKDSMSLFSRIGNSTRKLKLCYDLLRVDESVLVSLIKDLESINSDFEKYIRNFKEFIPLRKTYFQKLEELKQYDNIDFQEDKIKQLYEDIDLCNEEILRLDSQISLITEYRRKISNISQENYFIGGKDDLLQGRKFFSENAQEVFYQFIQVFEEYCASSKSWMNKGKLFNLEEEYKRKQGVLLGDIELSIQNLKIERDETASNVHKIEVRISDIVSANQRLKTEKLNLEDSLSEIKKRIVNLESEITQCFGDLSSVRAFQKKHTLFKSKEDLEDLLSFCNIVKDNRDSYINLFQNKEAILLYSFLNNLNLLQTEEANIFSVRYIKELNGCRFSDNIEDDINFEILPEGDWVYYINSCISDQVELQIAKGLKIEKVIENSGYWSVIFNDLSIAESLCKNTILSGASVCAKHSDSDNGLCCFYINGNEVDSQVKLISFLKENGLLRKTSNGVYYDISFKYEDSKSKRLLSQFINLNTGNFLV